MSSAWKQYGGLTQMENSRNININTLSTDNIILRKAYAGNFDICGSLVVNTNVYVDKDFYEYGNSYMNRLTANVLLINDRTDFNGPVYFHSEFHARNDILTQENISSQNAITVGTQLYFNNGVPGSTSADYNYMYGNIHGIGVNRIDPVATLDISSANVQSLNIFSSQPVNTNTLAQNAQGNGITLTAGVDSSVIGFFVNGAININNDTGDYNTVPDAFIQSNNDGTMQIETASDVFLQGNLIVTGTTHTNTYHRYGETMVVYDDLDLNTNSHYFGNIYLDPAAQHACALSLISNDSANNRSTTFMYMTSQNEFGAAIGGGVYPNAPSRAMSIRGLVDASAVNLFTPFETTVSSTNADKYLATVGINTYTPRTETCILDINGPVHIDNGDINNVVSMAFQVKYLNQAYAAPNYIMAVGTSIDVSGSYKIQGINSYRHPIYFSADYGKTWISQTIYPSNNVDANLDPIPDAVLKGDYLNQVSLYDASYAFITGNNNTLIYTFNGGYDWQNINVRGPTGGALPRLNFAGVAVYHVQNLSTNIVDTLSVYFTADNQLDQFATFDVSLSSLNYLRPIGNTLTVNVTIRTSTMAEIRTMCVSSNSVFFAGDKILVYSTANLSGSPLYSYNNGSLYWTYIHVKGQNVIAVGPQTIVSTTNGGSSWTNNLFTGWTLNDVSIYDTNKAIAVGEITGGGGGIILITQDGGISWANVTSSSPYYNWFNSSGKANLLLNSNAKLRDIVIADANTFLISNCSVDYSQFSPSVYGQSNVYSCFFPNYLNYKQNRVLDICGNMDIYGDITIHSRDDGYNQIETDLSCTSFGFINSSSIQTVTMAKYANTITIGDASTNIIIPGKLEAVTFQNDHENFNSISCDQFSSFTVGGTLTVSNTGTIRIASNRVVIGENLSPNNTILIGNTTVGSSATISVGGPTDTITVNSGMTALQGLTANGAIQLDGDLSIFQHNPGTPIQMTGNVLHTGNLRLSSQLDVGKHANLAGNLYVAGNILLTKNMITSGTSTFQGDVIVQNAGGILQLNASSGSSNTGVGAGILAGCSGTKNTALGTNVFSHIEESLSSVSGSKNIGIGDNVMNQYAMTGSYNTGIGQNSLYANQSGHNNNGFGNCSLTSNTTGLYNAGFGDGALQFSVKGNYNTAVGGSNALQNMGLNGVDGSYNTAIGTECMSNLDGGDYNTAIGAFAGNNLDNYILTNCTFLGAYARADTGAGTDSTMVNSTAVGCNSIITADHQIVLGTSAESVYIPSTNGVGIGKLATGGYALDISGSARCASLTQTSDYRIKQDICEIPTEYSTDSLRPVYYLNQLTGKREMGFLAHEVQKMFPFLVDGEKDDVDLQSMQYTGLIALLVKEIQDLKQKIDLIL
jgi:hypothetical protein